MTNLKLRAAVVAAFAHLAVATPVGASVVGGEVNFDETRCPGNCTGSAVNPFTGTSSISSVSTAIGSVPIALGGDLVKGHYLGGNSFGFDILNLANPSVGGIISGIDFSDPDSEISSITVSYTGGIDNAMLFSAFMSNSIAIFVESAEAGAETVDLSVKVDLAFEEQTAASDPDPATPEAAPTTPQVTPSAPSAPTPVPVPAGLPMLLLGLAGLGLLSRRARA